MVKRSRSRAEDVLGFQHPNPSNKTYSGPGRDDSPKRSTAGGEASPQGEPKKPRNLLGAARARAGHYSGHVSELYERMRLVFVVDEEQRYRLGVRLDELDFELTLDDRVEFDVDETGEVCALKPREDQAIAQ